MEVTPTDLQVHDMMDDIAEQQDVAKEISEAISNPVAFGQVVSLTAPGSWPVSTPLAGV